MIAVNPYLWIILYSNKVMSSIYHENFVKFSYTVLGKEALWWIYYQPFWESGLYCKLCMNDKGTSLLSEVRHIKCHFRFLINLSTERDRQTDIHSDVCSSQVDILFRSR